MLIKIVASSVLMIGILVIRAFFQKRVNPLFIYVLWLFVALRLLMPGMLFFSPISIMNTDLWRMGSTLLAREEDRQDRAYKDQKYRMYCEQKILEFQNLPEQELGTDEKSEPETGRQVELKWQWAGTLFGRLRQLAGIIWVAGMVITALIFLWQNLSMYYYLRSVRREFAEADGGRRKVPVFMAEDKLASPCLFGIAPAIYIPEGSIKADDKQQLAFVLEHELTHYRHGDHIWAFVRILCLIINWYNPLAWLSAGLSMRDGELACDADCIHRLGESKRCAYGEALLAMVKASGEREKVLKAATMMTSGKKFMKKRIERIAEQKKNNIFMLTIMVGIALFVVGCTYTGSGGMEEAEANPVTETVETNADAVTLQRQKYEKELGVRQALCDYDKDNIVYVSVYLENSDNEIISANIFVVSKDEITDEDEQDKIKAVAAEYLDLDVQDIDLMCMDSAAFTGQGTEN